MGSTPRRTRARRPAGPAGTPAERDGQDAASLRAGFAAHLKYSLAKDRYSATDHDRFLALAYAVRDRLMERWIETQQAYHRKNVKRVYYLSLEFLMGRSLLNNLVSLGVDGVGRGVVTRLGIDWERLLELEVDAGLGNGGLGRLAACFLDSLATLAYPAVGYGLRYEYGIFRQVIRDGAQVEEPDNWLRLGNPWEVARPEYMLPVHFGGRVEPDPAGGPLAFRWVDTRVILGMPYDTPIAGYRSPNVNTLRLWSARSGEEFDFADFSEGDYAAAVEQKVMAENLTKALYPDDRVFAGKELRLRQQYFLVACTLHDILRRHKNDRNPLEALPDKVAIQLNDTHPSLAVAELMRLLVDREGLPWEQAWAITTASIAYTNHTLLPEALEQWPVDLLERLLPRHLQIIDEVNRRFLEDVARRWPGDAERLARMSLIAEGPPKQVRMAHLATVGSHCVNGVSRIHTELLTTQLLPDFHAFFPDRFTNKTNGVTPRRWLRVCNPGLAALITERIGDGWVTDLDRLRDLEPAAADAAFRERFLLVKRKARDDLAAYVLATQGVRIDPATLFDVQVKRLHEYKRQLLNVLHIVLLYQRLRDDPGQDHEPRTFLFGAKAAPAYWMAKRIIRLIHAVGAALERDPLVKGRLRVVFLPDYRVSLAERIIPAADLSEQISTAGLEASGTSNMKFALNGALTIGTLDGANIEIRDEVGEDNIFIFGLRVDEVAAVRASGRNTGQEVYESDPEIRRLVDFLFSGDFDAGPPGQFEPIRQALLGRADPFLHLADLRSYAETQARVSALYRDRHAWADKAILNVARMGRFSSDRTTHEYASGIWRLKPVPVGPPPRGRR
ncbi:MAG: glycogen/starch/alpha-glucan phosphorylase [Candidatus Rokubacteria bacterium]|nr:glycogen/starch/alpha-glucan phosphorylase [Candidatus Rokubacteria bacterium]